MSLPKRTRRDLAAFVLTAAALIATAGPAPARLPSAIQIAFDTQLDALITSLRDLESATASRDARRTERSFREARLAYKRAETLLELYSPTTARLLNGPLSDGGPEGSALPIGAPAAFARMFDRPGVDEAQLMTRIVREFRANTGLLAIGDSALFEGARLEVARVVTLGITGFDAPDPRAALGEEASALEGMRELFDSGGYRQTALNAVLLRSAAALRSAHDFEAFDRLGFITGHGNVVARAIEDARLRAGVGHPSLRRVWRPGAPTVFEAHAFNPSAYSPATIPLAHDATVDLGRALFYDTRLSGPRSRSCASCHQPRRAFTDGRPQSVTFDGARGSVRNTPTLVNAALQPTLFADERAGSLEEQVARVLSSNAEMRSSPDLAADRVRDDPVYVEAFNRAFGPGTSVAPAIDPAAPISGVKVCVAIAEYMRSLIGLDSRADRALRGDTSALSKSERHGFNVYAGKGRCGTCHYLPLTNGTLPPEFTESEPEIIGTPAARGSSRVDPDPGRGAIDNVITHRGAFKVPTLRNVALTAPYMHNGAFWSLEDVVDFYDRGGGAGAGLRVPGQSLPATPLHLTPREKADLVAFLRALTDSTPIVSELRRRR